MAFSKHHDASAWQWQQVVAAMPALADRFRDFVDVVSNNEAVQFDSDSSISHNFQPTSLVLIEKLTKRSHHSIKHGKCNPPEYGQS